MSPSRQATSSTASTPTSTSSCFSARVRSAQQPRLPREPRKFTCGKSSVVSPLAEKLTDAAPILLPTAHSRNLAPPRDPSWIGLGKAAAAFQKQGRKGGTMAGKGAGRALWRAHLLSRATLNPSLSTA